MADVWHIWSKQYVFFAPAEWTCGPVAIIFELRPLRKGTLQPQYKAWALHRAAGGCRKQATLADINAIVGNKFGRNFYGMDDQGCITPFRFWVWLMGGEWDTGHVDEMLFQYDYFSLFAPPTAEYFARIQNRMNGIYGTFAPSEEAAEHGD